MKHAVSRELYDYWNGLRDGRTSPERGDIDPAAIRHILAYTFVLDVGAAGGDLALTIRLSGTRLNALFGSELKGRPFLDIWSTAHVAAVDALIGVVLDERLAVVAGACGATPFGDTIDLELLLLPLRHHGRTHARMLGSLAAIAAPTWIGLHAITGLDLTTARIVSAGRSDHRPPRFGAGIEALRIPATQTGDGAGRQVGSLRVYEGGRLAADPIGFGR